MKTLSWLCFVLLPAIVLADEVRENDYTRAIAEKRGWQAEVPMPDGTRCDLMSPTHAIEVERSHKWREAPAQAILYSIWTGKEPMIVLLVDDPDQDKLDILRCKMVCERLKIAIEFMKISK